MLTAWMRPPSAPPDRARAGSHRHDLRRVRGAHRKEPQSHSRREGGGQFRDRNRERRLRSRARRSCVAAHRGHPRGLRREHSPRSGRGPQARQGPQGRRIRSAAARVRRCGIVDGAVACPDGADARRGRLVRRRACGAAAALVAVAAGDAGAILDRPPLLHRRVACAARRRRQHGRARGAGNHDGVRVQRRRDAARPR